MTSHLKKIYEEPPIYSTTMKKKKSILGSYSLFLFSFILFRIGLDYVYINFVNPIYEYDFLSFKIEYSIDRYLSSWLLFIPCLLIINHRLTRFSDYFFSSATLSLIAPLTTIYGMDINKPIYPLIATQLSIFTIYTISRSRFFVIPKIPFFKNSLNILVFSSWGLVIFLVFWFVISGAVYNINFNPKLVYEFRDLNSEIIDIGLLAYLNLWIYKFFTIFLISYSLYKGKYITVIFLLLIQLFFYGITAHKITFFLPFFAISIWLYFRNSNLLIVMPVGYSCILAVSYSFYAIWDIQDVAAMLIRRVFFVPAAMTFEWFDFFSSMPDMLWADKVLSLFIDNPYDKPLPYVIGEHLLSPELAANNGYVSSGYAHAGIYGIIIYSFILGYVVKFFDVVSRQGVPLWLVIALSAGPFRTAMTDSDLLTTLLSHGLFISMIIVVLFRAKER